MIVNSMDMNDMGNNYDSGTLIVDKFNSSKIYTATQGPHEKLQDGGVIYSKNGGYNWTTIGGHKKQDPRSLPRGAMTDLLVEYVGSQRNLYVANDGYSSAVNPDSSGGVYYLEDVDSLNDWQLLFSANNTHRIAARKNFNELYIGVSEGLETPYGVYKLNKTGGTWQLETGPIYVCDNAIFYDFTTGPESDDIYLVTNKGFFIIDENDIVSEIIIPQFETLKGKGVDPAPEAIEIHPMKEDIIYLASPNTEVLKSYNRGLTWEEISLDIPTQGIGVLGLDPKQDTIYAEGPGSGIWKRKFIGTIYHLADKDEDKVISKTEVLNYKQEWKQNSADINSFMDSIKIWKEGGVY
ncbi:MAG: hypothetical protein ABIB79_02330 [archaeon]